MAAELVSLTALPYLHHQDECFHTAPARPPSAAMYRRQEQLMGSPFTRTSCTILLGPDAGPALLQGLSAIASDRAGLALPAAAGGGEKGITPPTHAISCQTSGGTSPPVLSPLGPAHLNPLNHTSHTLLCRGGAGPALMSAIAREGQGQLTHSYDPGVSSPDCLW